MRLRIHKLAGQSVLAGAGTGRAILSKLIAAIAGETDGPILYLDFENVDVATGSFLRETVLGFRAYCGQIGRSASSR